MSLEGLILTIIIIILSGCSNGTLEADLKREQELYCDMVTTYKETDGEYGWADYKGIYQKVCEVKRAY